MENPEFVHKINQVELKPTGNPPVHYYITATGSVLKSGYRTPVLVIRSTKPNRNGELFYYFAAEPPDSGADGSPVEIQAHRYLYDLLGVRKLIFVSATNEIQRSL